MLVQMGVAPGSGTKAPATDSVVAMWRIRDLRHLRRRSPSDRRQKPDCVPAKKSKFRLVMSPPSLTYAAFAVDATWTSLLNLADGDGGLGDEHRDGRDMGRQWVRWGR
uniref:Uncharacterized protein n=1 Tax=Mycena chlorophos TaxID=658473 RepID=A0ABQ0L878_MYCCL|nr:predicted protein [Mycena chlorophos]